MGSQIGGAKSVWKWAAARVQWYYEYLLVQ